MSSRCRRRPHRRRYQWLRLRRISERSAFSDMSLLWSTFVNRICTGYGMYICMFCLDGERSKSQTTAYFLVFLPWIYSYLGYSLPSSHTTSISSVHRYAYTRTHFLIIKINQGSLEYRGFFSSSLCFSSVLHSLSLTPNIDIRNFSIDINHNSPIQYSTIEKIEQTYHNHIYVYNMYTKLSNCENYTTIRVSVQYYHLARTPFHAKPTFDNCVCVVHPLKHCKMPAWSEPFD